MDFNCNLSDCQSPRFFRTLLNIQADLNIDVIWMIPILPEISSYLSLFLRLLGAILRTQTTISISCLNFWNEACWFLSLRVFGQLFSSLLLFPQRFGWYVLRPSSGVCWTREPSRNFELRPLLNPRGSPVLIPLAITGYKC